jgi:1-acyl-sn-glycerol-3-phosphate acyltransferase
MEGGKKNAIDQRDRKRYYLENTSFRRVITQILRLTFRLISKIEVIGIDNFPVSGPVVLAANHLSGFDMFPMQFTIPRPIFFMGKEELFRNVLMDALLRRLGSFPIKRGGRDEWAMGHAIKILEHEKILGIFPEGTRSRGRGLQPGKTGAARLAIAAHCPVVLMAIDGTQRLLNDFPRQTQVTITIKEPIPAKEGVSPLVFTDQLMFTLADMLPENLRGVYTIRPKGFR